MTDIISPHTTVRLGEIIEAATTEFTTQCYQLYEAPPLGSLVRCGDDSPIYGIVCEVATRSMDPARHPIPRGFDEDTEEGVYLSNPQLNRLLYTEFRAIVVGQKTGDGPSADSFDKLRGDSGQAFRRYLPPHPPRIHSFVYECGGDDLAAFSSSLEFLPIIMSASISAHDDVIASFLRHASAAHPDPQAFLVSAGKELAVLMAGQLTRLNNVLRRLSW